MFLISLLLKLLISVAFVILYQEGGQGHTWMKKWLAPSLLAALSLLIAFIDHKLNLLGAFGSLLYIGAANGFSYGDKLTKNKLGLKILFRGLCGASYGLCGLILGIAYNHLYLGITQLLLATAGSILLGVLNPFPNSWGNKATRAEDTGISSSYIVLVNFII